MSDDGDGDTMSDVYMSEAFPEIGSKMHFKYGLLDLWEFFCELLEITDEKNSVNYPITVFRFGNVPLKAPSKNSSSATTKKQQPSNIMMDDFDLLDEEDFSSEFEDGYDEEDDFSNDYYDEGVDEEDDYK